MTQKEFLSASLPYGLQIYYEWDGEIAIKLVGLSYNYEHMIYLELKHPHKRETDISLIKFAGKPIIRPLSDLTKKCVQADYNDGKPFVPIVELAKMVTNISGYKLVNRELGYVLQVKDREFLYHSGTNSFNFFIGSLKEIVPYQLQLFQQMIRWHFWPDMPDGEEVIYVTDEFNPYK